MSENKLYVGNISFSMTEETLTEVFAEFGTVTRAQIVTDRETGRSRGFAFVEMGTDDEAQAAIRGLDGQMVDGRNVTVNVARPREGGGRGGRGGMKGGSKVVVEKHRHEGVFVARGKEDALVTRNMVVGESVYGEKRISVDEADGTKTEYRVWNPFRSKVAAGILGGLDNIHIKPGTKLLYIGGASGTTVSHMSDLVGPEGTVYAVEFSHRSGRDLVNMAKKRTNVIPIIEDARHPQKYRMLVGMVDTIFADVAQPDQARIVGLNASYFLKAGGHFMISIKASCIDSTAAPEAVFAREVKKLQTEGFKPKEQLTLEPYERDHAMVVGIFRPGKK